MIQSIRRSIRNRFVARTAALAVAGLALAACDDDPTEPDPTYVWEAEIAGEGDFEDITGAVAVASNSSAFLAEIEIEAAPADAVFTWAVQEGTCEEPGDRVGSAAAYPDLEVDGDGAAAAEADDAVSLALDEDYIVTITDESGDDPVAVACAELARD